MAPDKQNPQTPDPSKTFTLVRRGLATPKTTENRPPDAMLAQVEDGTIVAGPDGIQWIAMAAVPRRWEKAKRQISTAATVPTSNPQTSEPQS